MKNLSFPFKSITLSMLLLVAFTACQKEEQSNPVDFTPQNPVATTYEAKVMQQTTNVIVSMLNENPDLFNEINDAIKSDAVEYMEDRILFADLFRNPQFARSVDGQAKHTTFSSEFKKHATANIQYAPAETRATTLDADALMQYLVDNNVSVYCPFPLEDYAEDNRIPAIAANIGEQYEELPGVQFHADGTYDSVMVSQAYADLHPVWLINHEDDYIFEKIYSRLDDSRKKFMLPEQGPIVDIPIYQEYNQISFNSMFITDYFGTLAGADLKIYLCKPSSTAPILDANGVYQNSYNLQQLYVIPRKTVKYAKEGLPTGWTFINYILDDNWIENRYYNYFAVYEKDSDINLTISENLNYMKNNINVGVNMTLNYYKYSDLICTMAIARHTVEDIFTTNDPIAYYVDNNGIYQYEAPDGYRLFMISNVVKFSIRKHTYTN